MRNISPYPLWIGHAGDSRDIQRLLGQGIQALVDLAANEPPLSPPRDLLYCRFPLVDGAENPTWLIRTAIQVTHSLIESRIPTLIFCSAGLSRSPAVAAAAIATLTGQSPHDALALIGASGPHDVSPHLWNDICKTIVLTA